MLGDITAATDIYIICGYTDMRKSIAHTPLLVRAPVNSFEFQPCGRTPQVDYLLC